MVEASAESGRASATARERPLDPVLFTLYIIAYIDRSNIGWASLDMSKSPAEGGLGLMNETIGFGAGMFFWSYWILEIPSTLSVLKRGARVGFYSYPSAMGHRSDTDGVPR